MTSTTSPPTNALLATYAQEPSTHRGSAERIPPTLNGSRAGLLMTAADGRLPAGSLVVCTVTGNGLKDPEWAISAAPAPVTIPIDGHAAAVSLGLAE